MFTEADLPGPSPGDRLSKISGEAQSHSLVSFGILACRILLKVLA